MTALPTVVFTTTDEGRALTQMLRSSFAARTPATVPDRAGALDRTAWRSLGTELGVLGLDVPEGLGGGGGTAADAAHLHREAGRACSSLPLLALAPVVALLAAAGDDLLESVLAGSTVVTVAGLPPAALTRVTATTEGDRVRLDGTVGAVVGGASADHLLVVADTDDGPVAVLVDADAEGHTTRECDSLDLSRAWSEHHFHGVRGRSLLLADAGRSVADALDTARIAAAADLVGIAEVSLHDAVEYAKIRYQFGRAIGSQQSVKHRAVDMSLAVERASAALDYAVRAPGDVRRVAALVALEAATTAAVQTAADALQIFGGIGMTWEHVAHLRLRRALADQAAFGTPAQHRRELATILWPVPDGGR